MFSTEVAPLVPFGWLAESKFNGESTFRSIRDLRKIRENHYFISCSQSFQSTDDPDEPCA